MITIITATFNAAETLANNLDCINDQNGENIREAAPWVEHLLIDGGSTDTTLKIAAEKGMHLSTIVSEPDKGIYDAMNKGIRLAQGEIIGILNADDFYTAPDVLAKVARVFEDSEIGACYGDLCYVKESPDACEGSTVSVYKAPVIEVVRYWKSGSFHPKKFYWGWMPPHPTFFVRRSVYEQYGLFNLDLGSAADYELMLRFLLRYGVKAAYIPEVLVKMRVGGMSNASVGNRVRANRNDRRAWEVNGLKPYPWTIPLKPIRKISQYWMRP